MLAGARRCWRSCISNSSVDKVVFSVFVVAVVPDVVEHGGVPCGPFVVAIGEVGRTEEPETPGTRRVSAASAAAAKSAARNCFWSAVRPLMSARVSSTSSATTGATCATASGSGGSACVRANAMNARRSGSRHIVIATRRSPPMFSARSATSCSAAGASTPSAPTRAPNIAPISPWLYARNRRTVGRNPLVLVSSVVLFVVVVGISVVAVSDFVVDSDVVVVGFNVDSDAVVVSDVDSDEFDCCCCFCCSRS